jgi:hypothetical protein
VQHGPEHRRCPGTRWCAVRRHRPGPRRTTHTPQARAVLRVFNWHADFDNLGDTAEGLHQILEESFETVEVDVVGSTANFTAAGPRRAEERI